MSGDNAGRRFRQALAAEVPLQIAGTVNAYTALLAERAGFRALYVSGAGVANASYGLPDLGLTSLDNVLEDVRRISAATSLPVLVDIDTGWGGAFNIARSIDQMARAGAAAVHIEDQVAQKRCGHRPNKAIVSTAEMCDRLKAALDARPSADFFVMARTDALAVDGFEAAVDRAGAYVAAGADGIFAEAMTDLSMYRRIAAAVDVPVLANVTEFGQTPLYGRDELAAASVRMVLYPLSAFRAMSAAADTVLRAIREHGTQRDVVDRMQTRAELYEVLGYDAFERKLDALFAEDAGTGDPERRP